jgi:hypothetical protein
MRSQICIYDKTVSYPDPRLASESLYLDPDPPKISANPKRSFSPCFSEKALLLVFVKIVKEFIGKKVSELGQETKKITPDFYDMLI